MPPELELVKLWLERATVDLCAAEVDVSHVLCVDQDHSFNQWRSSAGALTEFAVRFRYPEPGPAPSLEQARGYLDVARRVYDFVLQRLPKETHPSS